MNVLFITHYSSLYGANRSLINLLDGLKSYDIEPVIIIPYAGDIEGELLKRNIQYQILPVVSWVSDRTTTLRRMISCVVALYKSVKIINPYIKKWKTQLIYTNSSITPIGRILAILHRLPHVWHLREFGKLDFGKNYIFPKNLSINFIKQSNGVICISEALKKYYFGEKSSKPQVIYNGIASQIDLEKYKEKYQNKKKEPIFTFSMVGSIRPSKGQEIAIRAISDLSKMSYSARLIIVGDGNPNYQEFCKKLATDLGVNEAVRFSGYVYDPYFVFTATDCLLMCSQNEAFGRVTVEAMSACIPVIGKNSGGTSEIITHGKNGFLYNNYDELIEYMSKLVKQPELGQKFGMDGWVTVFNRFSQETYSQKVYEVIKSV